MSHNVIPFRPTAGPRALRTLNRAARRRQRNRPDLVPARDPDMELVATNIARSGLHLVHVGEQCDCGACAAEPLPTAERFGYTVGLTERGHPELLVRGLGARETAQLLGRWGGTALSGDTFAEGHLLCEGSEGSRWELVSVPRARRELAWATRYYGRDRLGHRPALELVPTKRPCLCTACG